jgi:hypothetical protein
MSIAPLKPGDDEHLAVAVVMASVTEHLSQMGCPPKLAIVALKVWLHVTEEVQSGQFVEPANESPEACEARMRVVVDKLWLETPDPQGAQA